MKTIDFQKLVGQKAKLYLSLDINTFQLGKVKFEVKEDENDGYRSAMDQVVIVDENINLKKSILIADVEIFTSEFGFCLADEKGYVWLDFGTDYSDSYYPHFIFNWNPQANTDDILKLINL